MAEGERAATGTCPEERCSDLAPAGLGFVGLHPTTAVRGSQRFWLIPSGPPPHPEWNADELTVTSSNPDVLSVEPGQDGDHVLRGVSEGSAMIRVSDRAGALLDRIELESRTVTHVEAYGEPEVSRLYEPSDYRMFHAFTPGRHAIWVSLLGRGDVVLADADGVQLDPHPALSSRAWSLEVEMTDTDLRLPLRAAGGWYALTVHAAGPVDDIVRTRRVELTECVCFRPTSRGEIVVGGEPLRFRVDGVAVEETRGCVQVPRRAGGGAVRVEATVGAVSRTFAVRAGDDRERFGCRADPLGSPLVAPLIEHSAARSPVVLQGERARRGHPGI